MAEPHLTGLHERHLERLAARFGESPEWVVERLVELACVEGWNRYQLEHGPYCPAPFYVRDDGEPVEIGWVEELGCHVADFGRQFAAAVVIRQVEKLLPGSIVSQGDNAHIDARTYTLHISVEQRAEILAEVGAALRPVLEQMQHRIAQLEHDNRALHDTLASLAPVIPAELSPGPSPPGSAPWGHPTTSVDAPRHVGSDHDREPPVTSWEPRAEVTPPEPGAAFYATLRGQW